MDRKIRSEGCIKLERAITAEERVRGLSGRDILSWDHGMLFVFDEPGKHCIWMKDMKFALDILWLDEDKKIIEIKENVSPATYPTSFCPPSPALYVIEINAGMAASYGLRPGQQLSI